MRVWEFDREDESGSPLITDEDNLKQILDELKNSDVGECYTVRVKDMSEEQFNALPEWGGW